MKIALLSHLASPTAPTGAEHSLALLAKGLAVRGHEVAVAAPGEWALTGELQRAGVEVASIPTRSCWLVQYDRQPVFRQLLRAVRYAVPDPGTAGLRRWLRAFDPAVVHVNCLPHLRGAAAARSLGVPVVWHIREMLPEGARRRWFGDRVRRDATRVVAVSEAVAGWLRDEDLGETVEVVHNGVRVPERLPERAASRKDLALPANAVVVGLFSQLVEHKGALDLILAAEASAADLQYLIAGHGPPAFLDRLRSEISTRGLTDRVHLVAPREDIWALLAGIDIAVLTTRWPDPLPRVVMEAMAAGRPVVAYDGGGVPEMVVDRETGILVPSGDIEALKKALANLAGDEPTRLRMGLAGRSRADRLFSADHHVDLMEAVLTSAGDESGG